MTTQGARPALLLSGGLHAAAARWPTKPALICGDVTLTYEALASRVRRVCGAVQAMGLRPGDRVAILSPNCAQYLELVVGLSDAGLIVATLNARSTAHEVAAACGFENACSFARAFRGHYHVTASGYRQQLHARAMPPLAAAVA